MTDQELLQAMSKMLQESEARMKATIQEEIDPINKRLEALEEGQAEIRNGVNTLLDWADKVGDSIAFPLPKIVP